MFYEQGFTESTVRAIAKASGAQITSFYALISKKEDLLMWVCEDIFDRFMPIIQKNKDFKGYPKQKLHHYIRLHMEQILYDVPLFEVASRYWQIADKNEGGKYGNYVTEYFTYAKEVVYGVFSHEQEVDFLHKDVTAYTFFQVVNHLAKCVVKTDGQYNYECIADEICDKFLNGFSNLK